MSQHIPQRSASHRQASVAEGLPPQVNEANYHLEDDEHTVEIFERILEDYYNRSNQLSILMPLVIFITGMGFFIDSYELFAIGLTSTIIEYVYENSPNSPNSTNGMTSPTNSTFFLQSLGKVSNSDADLQLKVAASSGAVLGSIFFGWLSDRYGRKRVYGIELLIIVGTTLAQAVAGNGVDRTSVNIFSVLTMWRFFMGIAIGGDYPSSAIIASEYFTKEHRGRILSTVFAFQGLGTLTAGIVTIICLKAYGFTDDLRKLDQIWRIVVGFVCLPGLIAVFFRYAIVEPPRYAFFAEMNPEKVQRFLADYQQHNQGYEQVLDVEEIKRRLQRSRGQSWKDFKMVLGREWKKLAYLSYSWFVVDFSFYGLGLNSSAIIKNVSRFSVMEDSDHPVGHYLKGISEGNFILLIGLLVGHALSIYFIDKIGRRSMQLMGFICVTVLLAIMGLLVRGNPDDSAWLGFFAIHVVLDMFQNFGANTTTFVLPAEYFPTRYRSTFYGIAAAVGKLGAVVTQILYSNIHGDGNGSKRIMILLFIYAGVSLTGIIPTLLLEETKERPLGGFSRNRVDLQLPENNLYGERAHGIHNGDYQQHAFNQQNPGAYPPEGWRPGT